jgi:hypothetical protein
VIRAQHEGRADLRGQAFHRGLDRPSERTPLGGDVGAIGARYRRFIDLEDVPLLSQHVHRRTRRDREDPCLQRSGPRGRKPRQRLQGGDQSVLRGVLGRPTTARTAQHSTHEGPDRPGVQLHDLGLRPTLTLLRRLDDRGLGLGRRVHGKAEDRRHTKEVVGGRRNGPRCRDRCVRGVRGRPE